MYKDAVILFKPLKTSASFKQNLKKITQLSKSYARGTMLERSSSFKTNTKSSRVPYKIWISCAPLDSMKFTDAIEMPSRSMILTLGSTSLRKTEMDWSDSRLRLWVKQNSIMRLVRTRTTQQICYNALKASCRWLYSRSPLWMRKIKSLRRK